MRSAPTRGGSRPNTVAHFKTPLFPAVVREYGQLYYDYGLNITTPSTALAINYFFNANGMFDPDTTGTGHQPFGVDQRRSL